MTDPAYPEPDDNPEPDDTPGASTGVNDAATLPGDTYQEGPFLVFTEQYQLRRGFCCNSSCRHCPYRAG